ncbi:protease inhibitor I9 family protein [Hyalangium rubrum]|uniref:Inhibitor I9 domain-containing protein n=1 Tax=Hyalangium rubrum TaxID=3103134 RepID=A0ABU5GW21_9BACT|nr:protease inhibitor I9 family protein [Hyalangium sp. s54d21]MDY7225392.1 hypothetical protein [Hyalangium sp. s54d21]
MRLPLVLLASLCLGFVACGPSMEDDAPVTEAPHSGRYLVRLREPASRDAAPSVRDQALELTARYGGTLVSVYERSFRGFTVEALPAPQAQALAGDPAVSQIEQDSRLGLTD